MNFSSASKKIFAKITVFDWIFIGLAVVTVLGFYLFFKRDTVFITAKFKVTNDNVFFQADPLQSEFALGYMVGDSEKDELGRVNAQIVSIESYKTAPNNQVVYLDIRLKALYNPRTEQYSVKGKNIIFGESFDFSFRKSHILAMVVDFPGFRDSKEIQSTKTIVKTQIRDTSRSFSDTYGIPDYLANGIHPGDTVKDSKGNVLAKILDIQILPAQRMVVSSAGQPFIVNDPYLKDVYCTIELSTTKIQGKTYMFGYIPVIVGNVVPFNTDTISVWPTITQIVK